MTPPEPTPGDQSVQWILEQLDPYLVAQAQWVAWMVGQLHGGRVDWEDLAQTARVYIWRYVQTRPETPLRFLLTIGRLRMYGEPLRGRSIDRAHPGKRKQRYERKLLAEADTIAHFPALTLTDSEEEALLQAVLSQARLTQDEHGEHLILLALRRLGKATGNEALYSEAHQQWREWWKVQRGKHRSTSDP